jgi:hypothetical protein
MTADTRASSYVWLMTPSEKDAIVRWIWEPKDGVITSSMGVGRLRFQTRSDSDPNQMGEWEDHEGINAHIADEMPWVVAKNVARSQGFTVEVPQYADPEHLLRG